MRINDGIASFAHIIGRGQRASDRTLSVVKSMTTNVAAASEPAQLVTFPKRLGGHQFHA